MITSPEQFNAVMDAFLSGWNRDPTKIFMRPDVAREFKKINDRNFAMISASTKDRNANWRKIKRAGNRSDKAIARIRRTNDNGR